MRTLPLVRERDAGALRQRCAMLIGNQLDGTFRMHLGDQDVAQAGLLSAFSEYTVMPEWSAIKIPSDIPLDVAALLGCAVPTGWGSAVNAAAVRPGDVVMVVGIGGIGVSAVQGAKHAGASRIIAVDPVELKRTTALELGATDACADHDEATELARSLTSGQGADSSIVCVGVVTPEVVSAAFSAIRKAGTVVVTAAGSDAVSDLPISLLELTMYQKRIQGSIYGMMSPVQGRPAAPRAVAGGPASPRGDAHPQLRAGRHQPGLRGHACRPQHPRHRLVRPARRREQRRHGGRGGRVALVPVADLRQLGLEL